MSSVIVDIFIATDYTGVTDERAVVSIFDEPVVAVVVLSWSGVT